MQLHPQGHRGHRPRLGELDRAVVDVARESFGVEEWRALIHAEQLRMALGGGDGRDALACRGQPDAMVTLERLIQGGAIKGLARELRGERERQPYLVERHRLSVHEP